MVDLKTLARLIAEYDWHRRRFIERISEPGYEPTEWDLEVLDHIVELNNEKSDL